MCSHINSHPIITGETLMQIATYILVVFETVVNIETIPRNRTQMTLNGVGLGCIGEEK